MLRTTTLLGVLVLGLVVLSAKVEAAKEDWVNIHNNLNKCLGTNTTIEFINDGRGKMRVGIFLPDKIIVVNHIARDLTPVNHIPFILAHEHSHALLKHHKSTKKGVHPHVIEYEADRLGVHVLMECGYDTQSAIDFFSDIPDQASPSHPGASARLKAVQNEIRAIKSKK